MTWRNVTLSTIWIWVSEWLLFNVKWRILTYIMERASYISMKWWYLFVLDQHTCKDFYSISSLKQQSACRHVTPLGHIIPIPSQPILFLLLMLCAANSNLIVLGMTQSASEHAIYHNWGENDNHTPQMQFIMNFT